MTTNIIEIQNEIKKELANKEVLKALINTTFKGLEQALVPRAIMEGMMRGFTFENFLKKDIYALPFKDKQGNQTYSLVTSIDYARKMGMRGGVVGTSAPTFEEREGTIISCTVTVKRKVGEHIGEYSATVYFNEYNTGYNLWKSKPRTMIGKVAEMHALRKACPEELSQSYTEEEVEREHVEIEAPKVDMESHTTKLKAVKNLDELKKVWADLPVQAKSSLESLKNELKETFTSEPKPPIENANA